MVDWRTFGLAAFFLAVAGAGVLVVHVVNKPVLWVERIPPHGQVFAKRSHEGLILAVQASALEISVPNCAIDRFPEKFFLHVYPYGEHNSRSNRFVNLDFTLAQLRAKKITRRGKTVCKYKKQFKHIRVRDVVVGQFDVPNGKCCRILWSRTFQSNDLFER